MGTVLEMYETTLEIRLTSDKLDQLAISFRPNPSAHTRFAVSRVMSLQIRISRTRLGLKAITSYTYTFVPGPTSVGQLRTLPRS